MRLHTVINESKTSQSQSTVLLGFGVFAIAVPLVLKAFDACNEVVAKMFYVP